ncbi:hypothetical protein N0V90_001516 [Kalmusia sp. IMI 367209]|nr:hypothetical protein N0V90_001516 [Kalmusia sp. IMI 367209]
MMGLATVKLLAALSGIAIAQFPPTPSGVTVLESQVEEGIKISYKENNVCETTDGVKSYSGYVHLPAGALEDLGVKNQTYEINTFFWFFESRKDPANAPPFDMDERWARKQLAIGVVARKRSLPLNMLYLDQPVQVGFSYDELTNVTVSSYTEAEGVEVADFSNGVPEQNNTFYVGTYPSQNENLTTRGTENSARALWNFAQVWFQEFPGYKPNDSRISIATESYGGRYGPAFAAYFQEQNERIENGTWDEVGETHILHLDTLLIINGCVDRLVQWPGYPVMAYNNTYGIQAYNESRHDEVLEALYGEDGCLAQIEDLAYDPTNQGYNSSVNSICKAAETFCTENIRDPYFDTDLNYYDISAPGAASFPPPWYEGFLNQPHVQESLGVPLNWTQSNSAVSTAFRGIGDYPRPGWKEDLAYLLEEGIKVTLVYGDRDYACNWYGGELLSLAINYSNTEDFHAAGYAPVQVNGSYIGGQVRQYGNLSFTRVYEAGHEVPAYQPETAYRIFMRALFNHDIATGNISTTENADYGSKGPETVFNITNEPVQLPGSQCYVLDKDQCTADQWASVENGTALVKNWIVVDANTSFLFPDLANGTGSGNGTVGTGTPTPSLGPSSTNGGAVPTENTGSASGRLVMQPWGLELRAVGSAMLVISLGSLMMVL